MDAVLALLTIGVMLGLGVVAFLLLTRMFSTIRELRGVTTGLNDTMRWAVGQVSAEPASRASAADGSTASPGRLGQG